MANDPHADIEWDQQGQPISRRFNDVYFSRHNGLAETRHVFLAANNLPQRWQRLSPAERFTVAETGFGSGLNFLATLASWRENAPQGACLDYVSVEKYPLSRADLAKALALWPELCAWGDALLAQYPPALSPGFHRLVLPGVSLTLIIGDAAWGIEQLTPATRPGPHTLCTNADWSACYDSRQVDAWFLDGFAPAKNPDMWRSELFAAMARVSHTGTTFATFTAAGIVRRGLAQVGFQVEKVPGFGRKRDMLRGEFKLDARCATEVAPPLLITQTPVSLNAAQWDHSWHMVAPTPLNKRHIAVIGGGLAGCHTAHALARRGFSVSLWEAGAIASGASGNARGVLYTKLSHTQGVLPDFNLAAYMHALRFYQREDLLTQCGVRCGVLHLAQTASLAEKYLAIAARFSSAPDLVQWCSAERASQLAGIDLHHSGLWFPHSGWLKPSAICHRLLQSPDIETHCHQSVAEVHYRAAGGWTLFDAAGQPLLECDQVVLCCAQAVGQFAATRELPVKPVRGQISRFQATEQSRNLDTVLCGEGYITPEQEGEHWLGATFNLHSLDPQPSKTDDCANGANCAAFSPALRALASTEAAASRVSFRCATPDYLPMVGPVPRYQDFTAQYARYRTNFRQPIDAPGPYWPGLYINVGHGSRGLIYTPLGADLITAMIAGDPLPLGRDQALHLSPARFWIRALARNKL